VIIAALIVFAVAMSATPGFTQQPGTLPPAGFLEETAPWPDQLEGIRPDAFLFKDESNTPVVMPRMSFEEIDRLRKLDRGVRTGDRVATLERLSIVGSSGPTRAQWDVQLQVRLEPSAIREMLGKSITIDLGLAGAHLLEAAEIRLTDVASATNENPPEPNRDTESEPTLGTLIPGAYVRFPVGGGAERIKITVPRQPGRGGDPAIVSPVGAATSQFLPDGFPAFLGNAIGAPSDRWGAASGGYQLVVPVEAVRSQSASPRNPPLILVKMSMSSRVWTTSPRQSWLPLQLPAVSTTLQMELQPAFANEDTTMSLEVIGSGREVVRRTEQPNRFLVECDGGLIALRWTTTPESSLNAGDLIEVESTTQLQWESPTEPPSMDVALLARNLRGPLRSCEIRLPPGAVLTSPPEVVESNIEPRSTTNSDSDSVPESGEASLWELRIERVEPSDNVAAKEPVNINESNPDDSSVDGEDATKDVPADTLADATTKVMLRWAGGDDVSIPSTVQVRLQLRQFTAEATAANPWVLKIPQISGAIGHRGQVSIRTAGDHRLRWRPRLGIDAIVSQQTSDKNGELVYPFRFTQTRFELPLWLSGKQQQTRVVAEAELQVTRRAARLQIEVQAGGSGIDPKGLRLELGAWRLLAITTDEQDSQLEMNTTDGLVQWQVDTSDGKWPQTYRITTELLASADTAAFESLALPRLVSSDSATLLSDVQLSVADGRRESWLVDLSESPGLQRIAGQNESNFRILSPESPWVLSGRFASLPLKIQWSGDVSMTQSSDTWVTRSTWSVTSELDLEGRLQFAVSALEKDRKTPSVAPENRIEQEATTATAMVTTSRGGANGDTNGALDSGATIDSDLSREQANGTAAAIDTAAVSTDETNDPNNAERGDDPLGNPTSEVSSSDTASVDTASVDTASSDTATSNGFSPDLSWSALVDGGPAIVREVSQASGGARASDSEFAERRVYEIVSPRLDTGTHRIELVFQQPIMVFSPAKTDAISIGPAAPRGEIASLLRLPVPVADHVELTSPLRLNMPVGATDSEGRFWNVLPELNGVLGNLYDASRFRWQSDGVLGQSVTPSSVPGTSPWTFEVIPDFPIPVVLRNRVGEEKLTEIPRSFLRSLVGKKFRHEHLMATVRGGRRVRLGLPSSLQTIRVEVRLDGQPVEYTRDATGLRIDLPDTKRVATDRSEASSVSSNPSSPIGEATGNEIGNETGNQTGNQTDAMLNNEDSSTHLLDVRLWTDQPSHPWWSRTEPLIRLPVGSGLQYWQLVVPTDSHLFWASSQSGRAMRWDRDQLKMSRVPAVSDAALIRWALDLDWQFGERIAGTVGSGDSNTTLDSEGNLDSNGNTVLQAAIRESLSNSTFTVPGNRYLFFAGNMFSFGSLTVSRTVLWLVVGGLVLLLASAFRWFPALNHPLFAFGLAIAIVGLLVIAPDGVVLTAQLVIISLSLVAIFYAISAIVVPTGNQRVLQPRTNNRDSHFSRGGGSQRGDSDLAGPTKPSRRDSSGGQTETRDFDPRYTPGGSPPAVPRGQSPEPTPPATSPAPTTPPTTSPTDEGYASQTGVFDASDPDSSEAVR